MFRKPGAGRSKASADTLCQKCLKRGHYSYECKASAQERPYVSRPSRTQQLLNPKLQPKLTTDVPDELLRKTGVADQILAKKESDRSHTRKSRKRSRSSSADSVSTISTNRSPSASPRRRKHHVPPKKSRRSPSVDSRSSSDSPARDRNTRRRMSSFSPGERGRKRTRSQSRSTSRARAPSDISDVDESHKNGPRSRSGATHGQRPARRFSPSRSPEPMDTSDDRGSRNGAPPRGRWGASPPARRSPSPARGRGRGRGERSPSPYSRRKAAQRGPSPYRGETRGENGRGGLQGGNGANGGRFGGRNRFDDGPVERTGRNAPPPAQPPHVQWERSLSPFSKRVALTRAMNGGAA